MDVLAQALDVAERAEAAKGSATLMFDLNDPVHRTAYAAALAVLRVSGVNEDELTASSGAQPERPRSGDGDEPGAESEPGDGASPLANLEGNAEQNAQLFKEYAAALKEINPDETRVATVARDTFRRIAALLRDGANIEAVAQIQYRRWVEEHLDAVR